MKKKTPVRKNGVKTETITYKTKDKSPGACSPDQKRCLYRLVHPLSRGRCKEEIPAEAAILEKKLAAHRDEGARLTEAFNKLMKPELSRQSRVSVQFKRDYAALELVLNFDPAPVARKAVTEFLAKYDGIMTRSDY